MEYSTYGRHVVMDVWGVSFDMLNDVHYLQKIMVEAAEKSHATVLSVSFKEFEPCGCTILVLLSESHLSIHTYPEKEFAAIDGYTCGKDKDPRLAIDFLIDLLQPKELFIKTLIRGRKEIDIID
ncbi:adenosylmethionine decarboxylase [Paenibacillus sp. sptzw28]|uniref:adenosylmethionine decarboxylase n=1 Tax=Paenibacillus sp. sptzw28 TaxID=715179 RepID=UPI001C6EC15E|nr:adenosylmethionine decarboxylase [Paenibacillus sp. sptzw28]QYR24028.1 adenosylmethionine decarboxylase [Paenibacillus sp. sptzw28]